MNIHNKTTIKSKEINGIIAKATSFVSPAISISIIAVFALLTLVLAVLNLAEFTGFTPIYPTITAIIMCIFIVLYSLPRTFAKTLLKQKGELKQDLVFEYTFLSSTFEVTSTINGDTTKSTFTYNNLYNVKNKRDYTLIYLTKADVLVVKYDGFTNNDKQLFLDKINNYTKKKG